jgi:hypothetical protein
MKRIIYIACCLAVFSACEEKDYDMIASATDDHTGSGGGDYYTGEGIDVSMYAKARIFPGLVDTTTEERLDEVILELDLTRKFAAATGMNLAYVPSTVYSTGLYAGAGEKITVQMDEDIKGLSVQIGIHTRDISALEAIERDPVLTTAMPLFQGKNEIRNPWGGYIWINRSGTDGSDREVFPLKVLGAYAAPDFVLGETGADAWVDKIKETTVPWIELRGRHYAFSVPTKYIQKKVNESGEAFADRLEEALELWDEWVRCIYEFYGLDGVDPDFLVPDYPVRAVMDVHLQNERYSFYNGNTIELLQTEELINQITMPESIKQGDLNTVHLMGWLQLYILKQVRSVSTWTPYPDAFSTVYPLLPNFYFLYKNGWWNGTNHVVQQYAVGGTQVMRRGSAYEMTADKFQQLISFAAADSCKLYNPNANVAGGYPYTAFAIFADIMSYRQEATGKNGWNFFGYYNRLAARNNNYNSRGMVNGLLNALTVYFERDFTAFFDRWGLEIADDVRASAAAFPPVEKCIWLHDPLTREAAPDYDGKVFYTRSGKMPLRHLRGAWVSTAYSGDGVALEPYNQREGMSPANLFDNNRNTLWQSHYDDYADYTDGSGIKRFAYHTDSLYYKARTPEFPYTVVIRPGDVGLERVDGFYLAFGNTTEASIYNADTSNYDSWTCHPQHVIVEVTSISLSYNESDSIFENLESAIWTRVYDSDNDPPGPDRQFRQEKHNLFYVDLDQTLERVQGIRLIFDRDSHAAKDRPANFPADAKPRRPEFANPYLNRIQKVGEFGTYYYTE